MVTLDRLLASQGDARRICGVTEGGLVVWSDVADLARFEVVRSVKFEEFSISHAQLGLNFVDCAFRDCVFRDLETNGHFWGAKDRWAACVFEQCRLHGIIAPMNSFERCRFVDVSIVNFKPHQTLFDSCLFSRGAIEGLKAHLISNSKVRNPDLKESFGQLLFRNCCFENVRFRQCYFEGVVFEHCRFDSTRATECSFEGIVSDVTWWEAQNVEPFTIFLTKALDLIRLKCGRDSAVYREFETYTIDYGSGRTRNKDFSACLYSNRVPYLETQKIIKDLRKLVASFPF